MAQIDSFLEEILKRRGSDLHFIAGDPPRIRLHGELSPLQGRAAAGGVRQDSAVRDHAASKAVERFESKDGADFAYTLDGKGRFRVNVMRQLNGMGAVFRAIPSQALTLDQLNMPHGGAPAVPRQQRTDPGHRQDRLGQIDLAGGDDR